MIEFRIDRITDPILREFAQRVSEEFRNQPYLRGQWRFVEITFTSNITNYKYPHNLGFVPNILNQVWKSGTGTVTWNYSSFDATNLDLTTASTSATDPLIVRAFVGNFREGSLV